MGSHLYLIGSSLLCLISAALLIGRRDLVRLTLLYGTIGGVVQVVTSFLYVRDYWAPPTILGTSVSVEDFLFGFGVTAYPFLVYPVITRKKFAPSQHHNRLGIYLSFGLVSAVVLFVGTLVLGANSLVLSLVLLALLTTIVCLMRRDLVVSAVFTIVFVTASVTILYMVVFNFVSPDWWNDHWLLAGLWVGPPGARRCASAGNVHLLGDPDQNRVAKDQFRPVGACGGEYGADQVVGDVGWRAEHMAVEHLSGVAVIGVHFLDQGQRQRRPVCR